MNTKLIPKSGTTLITSRMYYIKVNSENWIHIRRYSCKGSFLLVCVALRIKYIMKNEEVDIGTLALFNKDIIWKWKLKNEEPYIGTLLHSYIATVL